MKDLLINLVLPVVALALAGVPLNPFRTTI